MAIMSKSGQKLRLIRPELIFNLDEFSWFLVVLDEFSCFSYAASYVYSGLTSQSRKTWQEAVRCPVRWTRIDT